MTIRKKIARKYFLYKVSKFSLKVKDSKVLFIDLGANVGKAYEFFSNFYQNFTDFVLVEPQKNSFEFLKQEYENRVLLKNFAISGVSGGKNRLFFRLIPSGEVNIQLAPA